MRTLKLEIAFAIFWGLLFNSNGIVNAQHIMWEKNLTNYIGQVVSICKADNGGYLFTGYSTREYIYWNTNIYPRVYFGKIDENGDTLFIRPTNIYSQEVTMLKGRFQTYYVIAQRGAQYPSALSIQQFTEDGFLLSITELPGYFTYPYDATVDVNGNILIAGEIKPTPDTWQMGLLKLDPMGNFKFHVGFYPAGFGGVSTGQVVENMKGGEKYFLSGNRGSYVSTYQIDTNGVEISHKDLYRNKNSGGYIWASARQTIDSCFIIHGIYFYQNIGRVVFKKVRNNGDSVWGTETPKIGYQKFKTTSDGGCIGLHDSIDSFHRTFRKVDKNGNLVFSIPFATTTPIISGRSFNDFVSDDSGNAVLAGSFGSTNVTESFNFIKIANVGREYDPLVDTINTAIRPIKREVQRSYAIPNPTTGIFHVAGMGTGLFTLLDPQGKILYSSQKSGGEPVDISLYPPGIYTYTLETASSFTSGRVLKEK